MNVNLELYRIFYMVAKHKNMTSASRELCISQPAISQAIKKLEEGIGGTLFLRSNKGMELTEEGKMFYDYIKGALELIENAENEFTSFKDLSQGEIKIGCSTTLTKLLLVEVIQKYHEDFPNIHIHITNDQTSHLLENLKLGKLDFVLFNETSEKEKNVKLIKLKSLRQGFLTHPDDPHTIAHFEQLKSVPLILPKEGSNSRELLDEIALKHQMKLVPAMEVVSQDLIIEFTNAKLGVGFAIIDYAKKKYPYLKEHPINQELPSIDVSIATNKNVNLTFASKKFLEYLQK